MKIATINSTKNGKQFYTNRVGRNGEKRNTSEMYESKQAAWKGLVGDINDALAAAYQIAPGLFVNGVVKLTKADLAPYIIDLSPISTSKKTAVGKK